MRIGLVRAGLCAVLLGSVSVALAEDYTVATIGDAGPGGVRVIDKQGRQLTLTGNPFVVEMLANEGVLTVGGGIKDGVLRASYAKAYLTRALDIKVDGAAKHLNRGTGIEVVGKREIYVPPEEPEEVLTRWRVVIDGKRCLLKEELEDALSFVPRSRSIDTALVQGRVERDGASLVVADLERGRLVVQGPTAAVLEQAVGRFVEGYGVVFPRATPPAVYLEHVVGTTLQKARVYRQPDTGSESAKLDDYEDEYLVGAGRDGFLPVRHYWGNQETVTSWVPAAKLEIGHEWVEATGQVVKKTVDGDDTWFIVAGGKEWPVDYGAAQGQIRADSLQALVGQTIQVTGDVETVSYGRGELRLRSLVATVTRDIAPVGKLPAIPKGTVLEVIGMEEDWSSDDNPIDYTVRLPSGQKGALGTKNQDALQLGGTKSAGFVNELDPH